MTLYQGRFRVESARMKGWDYSWPGWYFVTICTFRKRHWLGEVECGRMRLSPEGEVLRDEWLQIPVIRKNVLLDEWQIMPNHMHGIVVINEVARGAGFLSDFNVETTQRVVSTSGTASPNHTLKPNSLGAIIGQFKSKCTKRIRAAGNNHFAWQDRYHDRIIRDNDELERIREYIRMNPSRWSP